MEIEHVPDLTTYSAFEAASLVDIDVYAVRAEGNRRAKAAAKEIDKLSKQLDKARADLMDANLILDAVWCELAKRPI